MLLEICRVFNGRTAFFDIGAGPFTWGDTTAPRGFRGALDTFNITASVLSTYKRYRFGRARPQQRTTTSAPIGALSWRRRSPTNGAFAS